VLIVDETITIADIDEAIVHIKELLVNTYGNRLTYQRRELLKSSIDDLLDIRLALVVR